MAGRRDRAGEVIDEMFGATGGAKGRSTDQRQDAYMPDLSEEFGDLGWRDWMVRFVDEVDGARQFRGTTPMSLVGHVNLDADGWRSFLERVHGAVYPEQVTAPVYMADVGTDVDVRKFIDGGEYEAPLRRSWPSSHEKLENLVDLADRLVYHPMSHPWIRQWLEEDRVWRSGDLRDQAIEIAEEKLRRPYSDEMTMGDVLNKISHPFGTSSLY